MPDAPAAAKVVVVVGKSFPVLELIEMTLRDAGHRVLATANPKEVVELARSVRIDVLVADCGDALTPIAKELALVQPDVRVVRICDPDELQGAAGNGVALARPVSLRELDGVVRELTGTAARPLRKCAGYSRSR